VYDYLIVGSGVFGAVCARELTDAGKSCLVVEKKDHIAGACYSHKVDGIEVHKYGPHIFHTSDKRLWDYVNRFTPFRQFQLKVLSYANDQIYSLPINFQTIRAHYPSVRSPEDARLL
jgi:UDP-galactopyranose mutase